MNPLMKVFVLAVKVMLLKGSITEEQALAMVDVARSLSRDELTIAIEELAVTA